jgi:predicted transcriptional regulator
MRKKTAGLSELEHQVLHVVCEMGAATTDRVRAALLPDKELADSTVRTLLHRLEVKGYVRHRVEGRSNVYECEVAPGQAATRAVRNVIDRFFHGSAESFLLGLVNDRVVSDEDLADVVAKLAKARPPVGGKKKP